MSAHQKKHQLDFKTRYDLRFDPQDNEIVVDAFGGNGAAGTQFMKGFERAVKGPKTTVLGRSACALPTTCLRQLTFVNFTSMILKKNSLFEVELANGGVCVYAPCLGDRYSLLSDENFTLIGE
jgi:hypothetical protein